MHTDTLKDYYELCKPRVVYLMLLTALIAMLLAVPAGESLPFRLILLGNLGIGLMAFAGGAINQLIDQRIDRIMARTCGRPVAAGRVKVGHGIAFALLMAVLGALVLVVGVNTLTAVLSFFTLIGYAIVYTCYLKRATPQNIVVGGLAGAMPPLLGWCAITNSVTVGALLLVAIIFTWTPPHFWALSVYRYEDYKKADIPMLPVTHSVAFTKTMILLYTALMIAVTYLPFAARLSGWIYCVGITVLNVWFLLSAIRACRSDNPRLAFKTFKHSILYLFALFILLLLDHYLLLTP